MSPRFAKCHACHTKWRSRLRSATRATQTAAAPTALNCHKCHASHAKWRSMSRSARPATQTAAAPTVPNGNQARPEPALHHKCHAATASTGHQARHQGHKCHLRICANSEPSAGMHLATAAQLSGRWSSFLRFSAAARPLEKPPGVCRWSPTNTKSDGCQGRYFM